MSRYAGGAGSAHQQDLISIMMLLRSDDPEATAQLQTLLTDAMKNPGALMGGGLRPGAPSRAPANPRRPPPAKPSHPGPTRAPSAANPRLIHPLAGYGSSQSSAAAPASTPAARVGGRGGTDMRSGTKRPATTAGGTVTTRREHGVGAKRRRANSDAAEDADGAKRRRANSEAEDADGTSGTQTGKVSQLGPPAPACSVEAVLLWAGGVGGEGCGWRRRGGWGGTRTPPPNIRSFACVKAKTTIRTRSSSLASWEKAGVVAGCELREWWGIARYVTDHHSSTRHLRCSGLSESQKDVSRSWERLDRGWPPLTAPPPPPHRTCCCPTR